MKSYRNIVFGLSTILFLLSVSGSFATPIEQRNHNQPATETCIPKETAGPEGPITIESGDTHYFFRETEEDHCTLWITATGGPVTVTATVYDQQPPCKPFPETNYMTRYIDLQGYCDSFFDLYVGYSQSEYDSSDYGPDEYCLTLARFDGDTTNCEGEWIKTLPTTVHDTPEGGYAQVTSRHLGLWHLGYYVDHTITPPVWVYSFNAIAGDQSTLLQWTTACETDNQGFYIERRSTGTNWTRVNTQIIEGVGSSPNFSNYTYRDQHLSNGVHYTYRLFYVLINGIEYTADVTAEVTTSFLGEATVITDYQLHQNYPNPFNPTTIIVYDLPDRRPVRLTVYNVMGQKVATLVDEVKDQGRCAATFDASSLPSGIYFCQMVAGKFKQIQKMVITK